MSKDKPVKPSTISSSVMQQISTNKVRMKPRLYFTVLSLASVAASVAAGLVVAYLASIMFFWVRIQTANTPARGARANLAENLANFPWWAVVVVALLIALSVVLIKRFGHLYRHKTSTLVLAFVALTLLLGIGFSYIGIAQPDHASNGGGGHGRQMKNN